MIMSKKENVQDVQEKPKKVKNEVTFWKVLAYILGGILALIGGLFADQKWNNGSITKSCSRGLKSVVAWVCNLFTPAKKETPATTVVQDGQGQQAPRNNNFEQRRVERPNHGQGNGYYNNKKPAQPEEKK